MSYCPQRLKEDIPKSFLNFYNKSNEGLASYKIKGEQSTKAENRYGIPLEENADDEQTLQTLDESRISDVSEKVNQEENHIEEEDFNVEQNGIDY